MSRVVFVGNVPYTMNEEQLIDFFKQVGNVVGFRLVYDRETGKPRGYGFCEFGDHQTAQSAVRNLNGKEVGGRALRIDLADSDPFLEGRTTGLPPGVSVPPGMTSLDVITDALTSIRPAQMLDVLAQMKTYVTNYPKQAHELLTHNPQLSFAIFQALILNDVVERSVIQRMQDAAKSVHPPAPSTSTTAYAHAQSYSQYPPAAMPGLGVPPPVPPGQGHQYMQPPAPSVTPVLQQLQNAYYQQQQPQVSNPSIYSQAPPQAQASAPPSTSSSIPPVDNLDQQRHLLLQLLQLSPEQINALGPNDRAVIEQLRSQYLNGQRQIS